MIVITRNRRKTAIQNGIFFQISRPAFFEAESRPKKAEFSQADSACENTGRKMGVFFPAFCTSPLLFVLDRESFSVMDEYTVIVHNGILTFLQAS
jgi:hypothetical protein